jgi:hypothetical protein
MDQFGGKTKNKSLTPFPLLVQDLTLSLSAVCSSGCVGRKE